VNKTQQHFSPKPMYQSYRQTEIKHNTCETISAAKT